MKLLSPSNTSTGGVVVVIEALDVVCPHLDPSLSEANTQAVTTLIDLFDTIHRMVVVSFFCSIIFSLVSR